MRWLAAASLWTSLETRLPLVGAMTQFRTTGISLISGDPEPMVYVIQPTLSHSSMVFALNYDAHQGLQESLAAETNQNIHLTARPPISTLKDHPITFALNMTLLLSQEVLVRSRKLREKGCVSSCMPRGTRILSYGMVRWSRCARSFGQKANVLYQILSHQRRHATVQADRCQAILAHMLHIIAHGSY
ncbi:uncharacterized protein SPPG_09078 [Spizellomyces punctatus DAOM BR117]|uniref:Uncharacterized protein n=1 Tax=Spizellomyces punctatus (strain DAOM BR117) TaxID=645134 RepID=A0A0L0HMF5_SPIPD|nr:uncharacterized protein SPPG_09078 [Spizellomyces punctatus DAOM BR117]KND02591.1 hypothetical protein SPPG_09078 [Spizellomyces punctatus DAOM BR117]|eukprot:XP_016610630.1 hypothetical protein SPPG_09078 [Spizellomyces punctatus DAOM BR117]